MTRKNTLKIATALIATTMIAAPIASAYSSPRDHSGWSMFGRDHHDGSKFDGARGEHGEHGKDGKFDHKSRIRATPLSTDEARILMDAMLLQTNAKDLKTGDVSLGSGNDADRINVSLTNADGDVVKVISFDAKTGRLARGDRHDLRDLLPRPEKGARFDRTFNADQMATLANAMVIRFGNGELKLDTISETPRGTYTAIVTNKAGDIVRETELSAVTGRPIR